MPLDALAGPFADLAAKHGFIPANHREPNFEAVTLRPVYDQHGEPILGYQSVWNETRRKTLAVHSDSYALIPNEAISGAFREALDLSSLDTTGMLVAQDYSHEGARFFEQYVLPAHVVEVKPGVEVALRLVNFNTYDGSGAARGVAGALNFVCANTSVAGNEAARFSFRHTGKGHDIKGAAERMVAAAEAFALEARAWRDWPQIPVDDQQAVAVFKAAPGASESIVEHLTLAWVTARDRDVVQGGANLWCLYNVLTAWATHTASRSNGVQARFTREGVVQKALATKEWKLLAA